MTGGILTTQQKEELVQHLIKFIQEEIKQGKELDWEDLLNKPHLIRIDYRFKFSDGTEITDEQEEFFDFHKTIAIYDVMINEERYRDILHSMIEDEEATMYVEHDDPENFILCLIEEMGIMMQGFGSPNTIYDVLWNLNSYLKDPSKFVWGFALQIQLAIVVFYLTYKYGIDISRFGDLSEAINKEGYDVDATGLDEEE